MASRLARPDPGAGGPSARQWLRERLRLPLVAAPMLRVSGVDLVAAACRVGIIGAFPTANCRSNDELDAWLTAIRRALEDSAEQDPRTGPFCANLIMRRSERQLRADVDCLVRHGAEIVITSVGSPQPIVGRLHDAGCLVLADVASMRHAEKAIQAGVDGLVLLSAGAGGQTGWANPFAFVRAVRRDYDGILALAGGLSDGASLLAATVLGCDLGLMGTRFIASFESLAENAYKGLLVEASLDDITLTRAFTGLPASFLTPSILAAGLDPASLPENLSVAEARARWGRDAGGDGPKRWSGLWSAGHSVAGVHDVPTVARIVARIEEEFRSAAPWPRQTLTTHPNGERHERSA